MAKFKRMKMCDCTDYLGPVNSWKALGVAVVRQAIIDWQQTALKLTHIETATKKSKELHDETVAFLRSSLVEFYSGLDGPTVLRKLKDGEFF